jgi:glutathione S-transferase
MTIKLYDLAAAEDDRLFSPYCWRVKMALAHKGLAFESVPWRFTEKEAIAFSGSTTVPVIVDATKVVADSWAIAQYLDEAYAARPRLFESEQARSLALFVRLWCERTLHGPILRAVLMDLYNGLAEKDQPYFRASREKRFGKTLEAAAADPPGAVAALRAALDPLRALLAGQPYLCGTEPAFADYIVFGAFQWARSVSPVKLLAADDPVHAWRERLLDLNDGLARRAKGYPV